MIQNQLILEKLKAKTGKDEVMHDFILSIMTNESEGKQYNKYFRSEIDKSVKQRLKEGGDK
mgnify:FL=1